MLKEIAGRCHTTEKSKRNVFIPFENQRDSIGRIIRPKTQARNAVNILELFENIKKTSKQYFFEKDLQKMKKKLNYLKQSLNEKQLDIDQQIQECIKIGSKFIEIEKNNDKVKQRFYLTLRENIENKINNVRVRLQKNKRPMPYTIHNNFILNEINENSQSAEINTNLFRQLGQRSEMMATFCANGKKYSKLVKQKKFNPWNKWYRNEEFEIFPGKSLQTKSLKKKIF